MWYFAIVFGLAVIATGTLAYYNYHQQLKPEGLEKAQALWKAKGPRDYVLVYTVKADNNGNSIENHYVVKVSSGKATEALVDGLPQPEGRLFNYGMPQLFGFIETFLEQDAAPGRPKTYTRALFNPDTGALGWYVRRVMGSRERVEIVVESLEAK